MRREGGTDDDGEGLGGLALLALALGELLPRAAARPAPDLGDADGEGGGGAALAHGQTHR